MAKTKIAKTKFAGGINQIPIAAMLVVVIGLGTSLSSQGAGDSRDSIKLPSKEKIAHQKTEVFHSIEKPRNPSALDEAKTRKRAEKKRIAALKKRLGKGMVFIPSGSFIMGCVSGVRL